MSNLPNTQGLNIIRLKPREFHFLQLACSELTYVQIADRMCVSPRTVDGYREALFNRFEIKSRVGLVLWALRSGLVA
jgi:DNA-binding CsgD family transcriptional regulator